MYVIKHFQKRVRAVIVNFPGRQDGDPLVPDTTPLSYDYYQVSVSRLESRALVMGYQLEYLGRTA